MTDLEAVRLHAYWRGRWARLLDDARRKVEDATHDDMRKYYESQVRDLEWQVKTHTRREEAAAGRVRAVLAAAADREATP